jgi:hypothetical protein
MAGAGCAEARRLLEYLNQQPPHRFTRMLRHLPEAIVFVEAMTMERKRQAAELSDPARRQEALESAERVHMRQLSLLRAMRDQPQPFYKPTARSVRIFSLNESMLRLNRDVRDIVTQDWTYFDLRSAQLAIFAHAWRVPDVQAFLEQDRSIWAELAIYLRTDLDGNLKDACKHALYALIFGASRQTIAGAFCDEGYPKVLARRFLQHPLVRAMLEARAAQHQRIRDAGGAENCFGQWIEIPLEWNGKRRRNVPNERSVLAQLAQAWELRLLVPAINLAAQTKQFTITAWLHDGFYVDFRDEMRAPQWEHRLVDAVNRQAQALDILTKLECSRKVVH